MIKEVAEDVYFDTEDALIHDVFPGFKEDYLCIHSLLRWYVPSSILEIGTNIGSGVNVMATALPKANIFSLDLDYETMRLNSKQYPIGTDGGDRCGSGATFPYTQLRGDSMTFDYESLPYIEAWYIDGEHDYKHAYHESVCAFSMQANLIIWHDSDMEPVMKGIQDAYEQYKEDYDLYRITDTRIAYAVRK